MVSGSRLFVMLEDLEHKVFNLTEQLAQQRQRIEQLEGENTEHQNTIRDLQNQAKQQQKKGVDNPPAMTKSKDFE